MLQWLRSILQAQGSKVHFKLKCWLSIPPVLMQTSSTCSSLLNAPRVTQALANELTNEIFI